MLSEAVRAKLSQLYTEVRLDYIRGPRTSPDLHALQDSDSENESDIFARWDSEAAAVNAFSAEGDDAQSKSMLTFTDFTDDGEPGEPYEVACTTTVVTGIPELFPPHPRYESCAPSDHNLGYRAGDSNHPLTIAAHFLPYADTVDMPPVGMESEEPFKARGYLEAFDDIVDWAELKSPDQEIVTYGFVCKAYSENDISLEDLDEFLSEHDLASVKETLAKITQRDLPSWITTDIDWHRRLVNATSQLDLSPEAQVRCGIQKICLLCGTACCARHTDDYYTCTEPGCTDGPGCNVSGHQRVQKREFVAQSIANDTADDIRTRSSRREPQSTFQCEGACFMTMSEDDEALARTRLRDHPLSDEERDYLLSTLQNFGPDAFPCDIGRLVGQPCIEVWLLRSDFVAEGKLSFEPANEERMSGSTRTISPIEDGDMDWNDDQKGIRLKAIPRPCNHIGPCSKSADCVCQNAGFHCMPSCLCDSNCDMRWKGCDCAQRGISCERDLDKCPCASSGRECEVATCVGCGLPSMQCKNMVLQCARRPRLEVKMGKYGLGTFAAEHIEKGRFVGEYSAEVNIHEHDGLKDYMRTHIGLNYSYNTTFAIPQDTTLRKVKKGKKKQTLAQPEIPFFTYDAARVGSSMRFMNDSYPKERNNVEVKYLFAQGEQHIAMFAKETIEAGHELYLGYGQDYWRGHGDAYGKHADADIEDSEEADIENGNEGEAD